MGFVQFDRNASTITGTALEHRTEEKVSLDRPWAIAA
jgi:hypothetical protein